MSSWKLYRTGGNDYAFTQHLPKSPSCRALSWLAGRSQYAFYQLLGIFFENLHGRICWTHALVPDIDVLVKLGQGERFLERVHDSSHCVKNALLRKKGRETGWAIVAVPGRLNDCFQGRWWWLGCFEDRTSKTELWIWLLEVVRDKGRLRMFGPNPWTKRDAILSDTWDWRLLHLGSRWGMWKGFMNELFYIF